MWRAGVKRARQKERAGRIVVVFRAALRVEPQVEAAVALASATGSEVSGLFVKEDRIFDLAGLPFAGARSSASRRLQPLTPDLVNRAYDLDAAVCRGIISERAERARIRWSFNVERGQLGAAYAEELAAGDYLAFAIAESGGLASFDVLEQLRLVPPDARGVVIAGHTRTTSPAGPVVAIDDGDEAGEGTVRLALRLAAAQNRQLVLFVVADGDAVAERILERAKMLAGPDTAVDFRRFGVGDAESIAAAFMSVDPCFIVADLKGEPFADEHAVQMLLRSAQAPVVLLRSAGQQDHA